MMEDVRRGLRVRWLMWICYDEKRGGGVYVSLLGMWLLMCFHIWEAAGKGIFL